VKSESKIFVAGHKGLVGSAILRELNLQGYENVCVRTRGELNLIDGQAVEKFLKDEYIEYVFLAAAKVGGIKANNEYPAEFLYQNLQIQNSVIHGSYLAGVKKLLFLGSSCIYPKFAEMPIKEKSLLTGPLEPTNQWYALAKIAGLKMCEAYNRQYGCTFIAAMPTNMYGPNDNYDLNTSHVLPALIRKFHEAKIAHAESVTLWGSGSPLREFLYSDDLANACIFLMQNYEDVNFINVGFGEDISICNLARLVGDITGFQGKVEWDTTKADGTPRKLMDSSRLFDLGWKPKVHLKQGIKLAYQDFLKKYDAVSSPPKKPS